MPENDLALLTEAALAAGKIARRFWKRNPETWEKPDSGGPVTEADLAVNHLLEQTLRTARPGYGWLSEESADDASRLNREHVFIVDPIDGTRAFIAGEEGFAHSLAVSRAGVITAAVVYLPAPDLLYSARADGPATLNGAPIHVTTSAQVPPSVLVTGGTLRPEFWPGGIPDLRRAFRSSLAWRLCLVAEGRYDGMMTLRDAWEWDIAAGALIAARAGAIVSDRTGAGLRFNQPERRAAGVLTAGPGLHRDLLARLVKTPKQDPNPV